ncbi:T3SS effector HopA1 family protein [Knoellia sp. CPCC 206453]|uniref:T3SS effector HopA1 family protein n=1 Tax=Knoellia pratensis TaxID=3404796 RepID=UPI003613937A
MSAWRRDHADQLLAAYAVLRHESDDCAPAELLYRQWYAVGSPHTSASRRWDPPAASAARAAHRGLSDWAGDEVEVLATGIAGVVVVATARGRRALCRGEYVTTSGRPGFPPRVGDRVRCPRRLGAVVQDGWWRTWGAGWDPQHHPDPLVRVYLRPLPGAGAPLVHAVTSVLAEADSWLLKLAPTPEGLARPDAVVTYIAGPTREMDRDSVVAAVVGLTGGTPPPLTERLADGVAWADDPGTGESFGEVRCAAIAAAYAGLQGNALTEGVWLDAVAAEFGRRGLDPAGPHRSPLTAGVSP